MSLKWIDQFDFAICYMIHANLVHGPRKDNQRFHQIRDMMHGVYNDLDHTTPLFQSNAGGIRGELADLGVEFPNVKSSSEESWDVCKAEDATTKKYDRLCFNRFMALIHVAKNESLPRWYRDKFERSHLVIEEDMAKGKMAKLFIKAGVHDEFSVATGPGTVSLEERALRSCLQNAATISFLFQADPVNLRRVLIMVAVHGALKDFHAGQSKDLRSANASVEWTKKMYDDDGFCKHLNDTVDRTRDVNMLESCQFITRPTDGRQNADATVCLEDEMANIMGQGSLAVVGARFRRCLYMWSWPHGFQRALLPGKKEQVVTTFLRDQRLDSEFGASGEKNALEKRVDNRSVFHLVPTQQGLIGIRRSDSKITPEFETMVETHVRGPISTSIIEEGFGIVKNNPELTGTSKYSRPPRAMGALVTSKLVDERFKYQAVDTCNALPKSTKLPDSAWRCPANHQSLPFDEIVTTNQVPPYPSPSATNYCVRDAKNQGA